MMAILVAMLIQLISAEDVGRISKLHGFNNTLDGKKAQEQLPVVIGSMLKAGKGNSFIEVKFDKSRLLLNGGQLEFNKDAQKKKGRRLLMTLTSGMLCLDSTGLSKDTHLRIKTGPQQLLIEGEDNASAFQCCLDRQKNQTYLYWKSGKANWQKIKPKKMRFNLKDDQWLQWADQDRGPADYIYSLQHKERFFELLENAPPQSK